MRTARRFATLVALAAAALLGAACAARPGGGRAPSARFGDDWASLPGVLPLTAVVAPEEVRDIVLTVYPTPQRVEYGDVLLPLDGARYLDEGGDDVDARLHDAGLDIGARELPDEGYALAVVSFEGRTVVVTSARDDAGRTWAALAVEQLTTTIGGRSYARACRILDAPSFALRGNKRPMAWERRYRANFVWELKDQPEHLSRTGVVTYAPGNPLDATRAGVDRILAEWHPWQDRGVKRFCVKFDDVGFDMTPETESRFGTYPAAVRSLVSALRTALRERDSEALIYLLPQTYWWNDPRLGPFARAIRAAGGLDGDVGLVLTGPEIISDTIDAAGLAGARNLFGSTDTPSLIYDNRGREGDWGPLDGRDPGIASLCDGIFGERGTPVNRLTRLDWLWNPEGFVAERSWRRALLELAGPEGYVALREACMAFRRGAPREDAARLVARFADGPAFDGPVPLSSLASLLRADLRRLTPRVAVSTASRP